MDKKKKKAIVAEEEQLVKATKGKVSLNQVDAYLAKKGITDKAERNEALSPIEPIKQVEEYKAAAPPSSKAKWFFIVLILLAIGFFTYFFDLFNLK